MVIRVYGLLSAMSDKDAFFKTEGGKKSRSRGFLRSCWMPLFLAAGLGLGLLLLALVVVDLTNSGEKIRRKLVSLLVETPQLSTPPSKAVEPTVVEKIVEVPVEKVVERVVEKIVEVEKLPPLPSRYVDWKKVDTATLWSEILVETKLETAEGGIASLERERPESYQIEMRVKLTVPKPSTSVADLIALNDKLPKILPDLEKLVTGAEVSPLYHHLYQLKTERIQQRVTRLDQVLSRHNFFDLETVLQATHPDTGQKLLLIQGEMDVVSDGSDGDRMPSLSEYISMSQHYQPFTSYGWAKRTKTPNPLLERWETQLKEHETEFALPGLSIERNRFLREQIDTYKLGVADMKGRSFLIAEVDPFIVLPLSFLGRTEESPFNPAIGDYVAVIYGDQIYPAIAGDAGPSWGFGEASLRMARQIDPKASPYQRPVSDLKVTYLIFPGSADEKKGPPDLVAWREKCGELLKGIGGLGEGFSLHEWENLVPAKKDPAPAADPTEAPTDPAKTATPETSPAKTPTTGTPAVEAPPPPTEGSPQ